MIIASIIFIVIAIFLEGYITTLSGYLDADLLLITLLLLYPAFKEKKTAYIILLLISTIMYDSLYTNILFLNTTILFCIFLFIEKNQKINDILFLIGSILFYHFLIFSLLYIIGYTKNPFQFVEILIISSIPNILYTGIFYFILNKFFLKQKIQYTSYYKNIHHKIK